VPATVRWTDDHCHLSADPVEAAASVAEAAEAGVKRLINVGTDPAASKAALDIARRHPGTVWATAGVHPHDASAGGLDAVEALVADGAVVAVGECGLDYHYDHSPRPVQRDVFEAQIVLARTHDMTLVVHTREAWDDTFAILASVGAPERTVFHCFTGGADEARRCLDLGGYLSFSGIVTFPSATDLRAAAALCPLNRLLVETDSPYLTPVPHRGQRNRPALVPLVGVAVAAAKGTSAEEVAEATWATADAVYRLDRASTFTTT
jgi:TatD DNase family protein